MPQNTKGDAETSPLVDHAGLERIPDHELHIGAVTGPDLELREESSAMFRAEQDIEATLNVRIVPSSTITVVAEAQDVQGWPRPT